MEAKIGLQPKHTKELLEVQWEATQGKAFRKPPVALPVIALYILKDKPYLLVDIPGGLSAYYSLEGDYSRREIAEALAADRGQLELPREVFKVLKALPVADKGKRQVRCWWDDPMGPELHTAAFGGALGGTQGRPPALFKLPADLEMVGVAPATAGDRPIAAKTN
jgi:hypothetical protein